MAQLDGTEEALKSGRNADLGRPALPLVLRQASKFPAIGGTRPGSLAAALARALEERRLFVLLPFAIIAGLTASLAGGAQPQPWLLLVVGAGVSSCFPLLWRSIVAVRLLALGAAFWLGFSLLSIHGALSGTQMLPYATYGTYEARVDEVLSTGESGTRVIVSGIAPASGARPVAIRRARLVVADHGQLSPGDTLRGAIRFYPVPGPVIPGGFDTQFHAYFDGIGAYGNVVKEFTLVRQGDSSAPERFVEGIRRTISERIDRELPQPAAGIARALITGDQSEVTDEARAAMSTAGLAHVLSVSGLHLTIVAGGVFVAIRMLLSLFEGLQRVLSVKRVAAAGGIVASLAYFAISGGNVAALRATVMIVLVFGAIIVGRRALTMRNVAFAALVVLVTDPASVFRPSFQLSFAAVVALIGVWELARSREGRDRSLFQQALAYFGGIIATSFVAGAATLLFSVYHFQQTSPLGVLGNLATLPLVGFVMMPAATFGALLMPLNLEYPFLAALGWSIDRMLDVAHVVAAMSGGFDASPLLTPLALILGLAAFAWFAFLPTWHRLMGPLLLIPAVGLFALDRPPDVLIADSSQAIALRLEGGLKVVSGKAHGFAVDVWRETYGEPFSAAAIACDSVACIGRSQAGFTVAIVKDPSGFYEECDADLVITRRFAPHACTGHTIVDARSLETGGVHWLAWNAVMRSFEVRPAISDSNRPWRIAN